MKIPRKLKKGIRTLNVKPKTKWQRRGQIVVVNFLNGSALIASVLAYIDSLPYQRTHKFKPGGIVAPNSERNSCMNSRERIIAHENVEALMRSINDKDEEHWIDDPLMVVNVKPDFSGLGLEPIHKTKKGL